MRASQTTRPGTVVVAASAAGVLVLAIMALLASPTESAACTVFAVASDETVVGANLDWADELEGYVLLNPRGLKKTFVPWSGFGPTEFEGETLTWRSQYASLTLTCSGRDFIEGGMNERGLVLEQANLPSVYPPEDDRPGVSSQQWMQYILDTCQTVGDVVDALGSVRQDGEGWHYLAVDRSGDWAVIEFLDGSPVVHRSGQHEFPVITNATYAETESHVPQDIRFGGELDVGAEDDSYGRFVRVAERLRDRRGAWRRYTPDAPADTTGQRASWNSQGRVEFAFALLEDVSGDDTQRSVIYDTAAMRVYWRSWRHDALRYVRFAVTPPAARDTRYAIPIHAPVAGDATEALQPLSDRQNWKLQKAFSEMIEGVSDGEQDTD